MNKYNKNSYALEMELSELPIEILCNIFKYLNIKSALNVCDVSEYFRNIILLCNYNFGYKIDMEMRNILNCTNYEISADFNLKEWAAKNFKNNNSVSFIEYYDDLETKFIKCMEGKKVTLRYDNGKLDYKLILKCKELNYIRPKMFSFPAELEGISKVGIHIYMSNHYDYKKFNNYDLTYLRSSKSVKIFNIDKCVDMSTLSCLVNNVKYLELFYCQDLNDEHTKYFRNMKRLNIESSGITSTENFSNIKYLNLSDTKINDVSNLGNVKNLNLACCREIVDFTPLRNVKYLNIRSSNITDISILTGVKKLTICQCKHIIGFESLNNVKIERVECCFRCTHPYFNFL